MFNCVHMIILFSFIAIITPKFSLPCQVSIQLIGALLLSLLGSGKTETLEQENPRRETSKQKRFRQDHVE